MHPQNPQILFSVFWNKLGFNNRGVVSGPDGQIFKSIDGGQNWKKLKSGLPSDSLNGRIALSISESNPNILYARYIRTYYCDNQLSNNLFALYKSEDTGETWNELPSLQSGSGIDCGITGGFGWYFQNMAIHPNDPDLIYLMSVNLFHSDDGGNHWILSEPQFGSTDVHADKHAMAFFKNGDYLLGTDGGLYKYIQANDSWQDLENIPTNQIYRVAYNPFEPDFYYGGLQDNGSTGGNALTIDNWDRIYGGDGFQMDFNKKDPTIFYAEYQNGAIQQYYHGNWRGFNRGLNGSKNWDFPYRISKHNPGKLIAGSNQMYVNLSDTIAAWQAISPNLVSIPRYPSRSSPTISCFDESPLDSTILIAGTINGNVWLTKQFNANWKNISSNLPAAYITSVKTSHINPNVFYVSLSGHRGNDFKSYVYKTIDNGLNWTSIQGDLPELPVYDLLVYPGRNDSILFIGNHIGVYASTDAGSSWKRVGDNMPYIEVYDLDINTANNTLMAGTFGKSIMSFPLKSILTSVVKTETISNQIKFTLSPNPASESIRLNFKEIDCPVKLSIYNETGQLKWRGLKTIEEEINIDLSSFRAGIYFVQLNGSGLHLNQSFVKI